MDILTALIIDLIVIAVLFEVARRANLPYPALFVLGGLALGFIPGLPSIHLEPELVLLVFLPPLLFVAAFETPQRDLRRNLWPIARLSIVLVVLTTVVVAAVAQALVPGLGWAAAFALGAIVAPTDALAATSVFRRLGVPRIAITLIEGELLFNDATALIAYRAAVVATVTGVFVLSETLAAFLVAAAGGIALGWIVGRVVGEVVRWLDDPPVEVVVSLLVPWAAYLPAEQFELSGVLAVVTAGLVIGRRLGTILSPSSRVLWLTSWKMVGFVLNGLIFVLIGLALPDILRRPWRHVAGARARPRAPRVRGRDRHPICLRVPGQPAAELATPARGPAGPEAWPSRLTFLVAWSGLRGAVSLAAALALPTDFPERSLIQLADVRGHPRDPRRPGADAPVRGALGALGRRGSRWRRSNVRAGDDVPPRAGRGAPCPRSLAGPRAVARPAGIGPRRPHAAPRDRGPGGDRGATPGAQEHREIQLYVINAQRAAAIALRDGGEINDATLRELERELDLEELRMEA